VEARLKAGGEEQMHQTSTSRLQPLRRRALTRQVVQPAAEGDHAAVAGGGHEEGRAEVAAGLQAAAGAGTSGVPAHCLGTPAWAWAKPHGSKGAC
jgi:hypothetical protein